MAVAQGHLIHAAQNHNVAPGTVSTTFHQKLSPHGNWSNFFSAQAWRDEMDDAAVEEMLQQYEAEQQEREQAYGEA